MQTNAFCPRRIVSVFVLLAAASITATAGAQQPAASNEQVLRITAKRNDLELVESFAKIFELQAKIKRVDGFDPDAVSYTHLTLPTIDSV